MSLINDALKRTQQTTQANEPPRLGELELHPFEPGPPPPQNDGSGTKRVIWIVVLLVLALNMVLWIMFKNRGDATEAAARSIDEQFEALVAQGEQGAQPLEVQAPELAAQPASVESSGPPTNATTLNPPELQRPEFRLNTVVVHPTHPSAMINNRVVFVGDKVEGYTVSAIGKDDVTLTLDGDEVVVSLP